MSDDNSRYNFYGWQDADVLPVDPNYEKAGTPRDLYDILSGIWQADTCAPRMRDEWSEENRTLGQCSITAFLVQDIYGGEVYGILRPAGNYHCYNVVDGKVFDLTSEQFGEEVKLLSYENNPVQLRQDHFSKREKRLRYELLRNRLQDALGSWRRMRRFAQQVSYEKCYEVLEKQWRGVLSLQGDNGYPHGIVLDYFFDPVLGRMYFHGAREGYKVDLIRNNPKASFCVWDEGFKKEGDWALNINSIICYGTLRFIDPSEEIFLKSLRNLGGKYYTSEGQTEEEIRKAGSRVLMTEFTIERMTGKLVNES
ncbi:MAG: pyridoxamine 5'-phosphate oxidase family protein [Clostridiales bacterium]|nr:pyridoxamine 5'-phosphate oxidase family protein [Clostridiales bacterium]